MTEELSPFYPVFQDLNSYLHDPKCNLPFQNCKSKKNEKIFLLRSNRTGDQSKRELFNFKRNDSG